jgi:hypothetical protein
VSATVAVFLLMMERQPKLSIVESAESFSISLLSFLGASMPYINDALHSVALFPIPSQQPQRPELSRRRRESSLLQPRVDPLVCRFAAALDPLPSFVPR